MAEAGARASKFIVAGLVVIVGLVILIPNALPLVHHWRADRASAVVARWDGSTVTSSSRDTVAVPHYRFERRIGPMVQECRVDFVKYRHAPGGRPAFETLNVVAGTTCDDLVVLDDPPRERWPLVLIGLAALLGGLVLAGLAFRAGRKPA